MSMHENYYYYFDIYVYKIYLNWTIYLLKKVIIILVTCKEMESVEN